MIKYLILFLLLAHNVWAGGVMFTAGGVDVVGGDGSVGQITHIDPTTIGGNNQLYSEFVADPGPAGFGHVYGANFAVDDITITIYNLSGVVLAYASTSSTTDTAQWYNLTLNTPIVLTASTYYCSFNCSNGGDVYDDNSGTGNTDFEAQAWSATPSDISPPGTEFNSDNLAIIFNNTAGSPE